MRFLAIGFGFVAATALAAVSAAVNFLFLFGFAGGGVSGLVLGGASVLGDAVKSMLPLGIRRAIAERQVVYVAIAVPAFVVLVIVAFGSAVGYLSSQFGAAAGGREALQAKLEFAARELSELDDKRSRLTGEPSTDAVRANLHSLEQNRRWTSTRQCTDATAKRSRTFCQLYFKTKAQLAASLEADRVAERKRELRAEVSRLTAAGASQAADPQAEMIAKLLTYMGRETDTPEARMGMVIVMAIVLEILASLGFFLVFGHGGLTRKTAPAAVEGSPVNQKVIHEDNQIPEAPENIEGSPGSQKVIPLRDRAPKRFIMNEDAKRWAAAE
ncbi:MAG: hypothetical protein V3V97_20535 [Hyphomicrobiaceae bacterium]